MKWAKIISTENEECFVTPTSHGTYRMLYGDPFEMGFQVSPREVSPKTWLPPVQPPAIICIGLNYHGHAQETNKPIPQYPIVFMKNPGAITAHQRPIKIPKVCSEEVDFEGELVVIIKKDALNVKRENANEYIAGFTIGNDVSARKWQMDLGGGQWVRAKSFDTFAPIGPFVLPLIDSPPLSSLEITTRLNNKVVQKGFVGDMIFDVFELIEFLSQDTTLKKGTVIFTGTPAGVGWARTPKLYLKDGDVISVEITHIGTLENPVVEPKR